MIYMNTDLQLLDKMYTQKYPAHKWKSLHGHVCSKIVQIYYITLMSHAQ